MRLADDLPGQLHVHPVTQVEENACVELADDLSDELLVHLVPQVEETAGVGLADDLPGQPHAHPVTQVQQLLEKGRSSLKYIVKQFLKSYSLHSNFIFLKPENQGSEHQNLR